MKSEIKKKICILLSICTLFISSSVKEKDSKKSKDINNQIEIIYNEDYSYGKYDFFACINGIKIYIGSERYIKGIENENSDDIFVIDERYLTDANMEIMNSYKIKDIKQMRTILLVLQKYERMYPSAWDRTTETMILEWICHNASYDLNFLVERSKHVDLNNDDENLYLTLINHK